MDVEASKGRGWIFGLLSKLGDGCLEFGRVEFDVIEDVEKAWRYWTFLTSAELCWKLLGSSTSHPHLS